MRRHPYATVVPSAERHRARSRARRHDNRQRPRPERGREAQLAAPNRRRRAPARRPRRRAAGPRCGPPLQRQQLLHRVVIPRIDGKAVEGVGRKGDDTAAARTSTACAIARGSGSSGVNSDPNHENSFQPITPGPHPGLRVGARTRARRRFCLLSPASFRSPLSPARSSPAAAPRSSAATRATRAR